MRYIQPWTYNKLRNLAVTLFVLRDDDNVPLRAIIFFKIPDYKILAQCSLAWDNTGKLIKDRYGIFS